MARKLPALRASVSAVARQDIPVLAGDQRDPSRCPAGARTEACDARARHTGWVSKNRTGLRLTQGVESSNNGIELLH